MATQTTHYNLTKPEMSDTVGADIPALAANFEIIDTQLYNANTRTFPVDAALSNSSLNPVQNQVITAALNDIETEIGNIETVLATVVTV